VAPINKFTILFPFDLKPEIGQQYTSNRTATALKLKDHDNTFHYLAAWSSLISSSHKERLSLAALRPEGTARLI
jgi:hypothetical protein